MDFEDKFFDQLDDQIYHFTTREVAFEHVLFDRTLKLGLRSSFDDIAENSQITVTLKSSYDPDESKEESWKVGEKVLRLQDFCINGVRAACFCAKETTDYPGFVKSPRMWSQYAGGQNGVCFVFSKKALTKTILENVDDPEAYQFDDVNYKEYPFSHSIQLQKTYVRDNSYETIHEEFFFEKYRNVFFEKHSDYHDEKEFRILYTGFRGTQYIHFHNSLLAVILGKQVSNAYLPAIEKYSKDGILFYRNEYYGGFPRVSEFPGGIF